ncbi:MAG: sugar ABC transporter permease [Catenulisporales bacterium]|nr:sugar ABC transporter permease [Catenulisporales bacterium]
MAALDGALESADAVPEAARSGSRRPRSALLSRDHGLAWLFLLPSLAVFAVFILYPLVESFVLSAHGSDIFGNSSRFVGLKHFRDLFADQDFYNVLGTTATFTALTVFPGVLGALALVLLMESRIRGIRVFRSAFALPFAFSAASASVIFAVIYNPAVGIANGMLNHVGAKPVGWLIDPNWVLLSVAAVQVWMTLGYNVLVLSAGVAAIPADIVEAARLDGATGWRLHRSVIVPLLSPQLFFLTVVSTINSLQAFTAIRVLAPEGGPGGKAMTLVYAIYNKGFENGNSDLGTASAYAIVLLFIVLVFTAIQFGVLERKVFYR